VTGFKNNERSARAGKATAMENGLYTPQVEPFNMAAGLKT
jgi:hypothetical protein